MNMPSLNLLASRWAVAYRTPATVRRLVGAVVVVCAAAVLGVAAFLDPSPAGLGTHTSLNLPGCTWIAIMDVPCPTCGMTTAFAHAANGDLAASLYTQPLGFLLAIVTAGALLVGAYVVWTGSRVAAMFGALWGRSTGWWLGGLAVGAWGFKILTYKGIIFR